MTMICCNGRFSPEWQSVLKINNRSFKWGDGVFETMKYENGRLLLQELHFDRLSRSLALLGISDAEQVQGERILPLIDRLCTYNKCTERARVRLAVYRNELNKPDYCIEASPLDNETGKWNDKGLVIGIYPSVRKAKDSLANLKTANYLPYIMAGRYAEENGWDDSLVLNATDQICDSSRANVFLIKQDVLLTPSLDQGCINGVYRRFLLEAGLDLTIRECALNANDLLQADEIFLTNAIRGIQWVSRFGTKEYGQQLTAQLFQQVATF
jgi:branched-chain amino acid aminotransferase